MQGCQAKACRRPRPATPKWSPCDSGQTQALEVPGLNYSAISIFEVMAETKGLELYNEINSLERPTCLNLPYLPLTVFSDLANLSASTFSVLPSIAFRLKKGMPH